ncbi:MAG: hypothetical protein EHM70_15470 [Chloroflexota bacterium]|nr:MAG: hypothetical protein EHM70_15470 [Chloroflexota bacterium]
MNHQPFETWLLSEESLLPEQGRALREHLRDCEACRQLETSWAGVHQFLRSAEPATPAVGFTLRWQERLAEQKIIRHKRQSWAMLFFTSGMAMLLLLFLGTQAFDLLNDPGPLLLLWASRLVTLLFYADATRDIVLTLLRSIITVVPLPMWVLLTGMLSILCVLWAVAIQQLTSARRIST